MQDQNYTASGELLYKSTPQTLSTIARNEGVYLYFCVGVCVRGGWGNTTLILYCLHEHHCNTTVTLGVMSLWAGFPAYFLRGGTETILLSSLFSRLSPVPHEDNSLILYISRELI
jgi:hypothetical protein